MHSCTPINFNTELYEGINLILTLILKICINEEEILDKMSGKKHQQVS